MRDQTKRGPGTYFAFLKAVFDAGSGTPAADTAVEAEKKRALSAGASPMLLTHTLSRLSRFLLHSDGEPAALTEAGIRWLNAHGVPCASG